MEEQQLGRRADAERNRERILAAAKAAFADTNADVSMAEIARRADVGSATLYRNFANRRELLEAIYVTEIDGICDAASSSDGESPGALLTQWLRQFFAYFQHKQVVAAELLQHASTDDPVFGTGLVRVLAAGRPLLIAAQESGEVRTQLTLEQVLDLIAAVARLGADAAYRAPILATVLDGLRAIDQS